MKPTVRIDDPSAKWRVPAHVLAEANAQDAPTPEQKRRIADGMRAHSLMASPAGDLHPILLTGYIADPMLPFVFMEETAGCRIATVARAPWAEEDPTLPQVAVYTTPEFSGLPFNPFGSLLASDLGYALLPLYGPVFFCRVPDPVTHVMAKLSPQVKDLIAYKLVTMQAALNGNRPPYMSPEAYQELWSRAKAVIAAHRATTD